jgi:hypothetical protein
VTVQTGCGGACTLDSYCSAVAVLASCVLAAFREARVPMAFESSGRLCYRSVSALRLALSPALPCSFLPPAAALQRTPCRDALEALLPGPPCHSVALNSRTSSPRAHDLRESHSRMAALALPLYPARISPPSPPPCPAPHSRRSPSPSQRSQSAVLALASAADSSEHALEGVHPRRKSVGLKTACSHIGVRHAMSAIIERLSRRIAASQANTTHVSTFTQPSRDTAPYRDAWWIAAGLDP